MGSVSGTQDWKKLGVHMGVPSSFIGGQTGGTTANVSSQVLPEGQVNFWGRIPA